MYVLKFTDDGLADVRSLPKNVRNVLKRQLKDTVAANPVSYSEELVGPLRGWRSFHSGEYRVIFKIYDDLRAIAIAGVGKHDSDSARDVYKRLEQLAKTGKLADELRAALSLRGFTVPVVSVHPK